MDATFVLVHSPSVGPLTWAPVARRLEDRGRAVAVPSLLHVADAGPPFWRAVAEAVAGAVDDRPAVVVAHSNAGLFVPAQAGPTPVAPAELLDFLRPKVTGGRLPPWTEWWDETDIAPMFPDGPTRDAVSGEQPRLPLSYYEASVPVPAGWDDRPCAYLWFGEPYGTVAEDARGRGWPVERVPGRHLHQLVDPDAPGATPAAYSCARTAEESTLAVHSTSSGRRLSTAATTHRSAGQGLGRRSAPQREASTVVKPPGATATVIRPDVVV